MEDTNGKKNIDERLDALTMNLELLSHQSAEHDRQIGELRESVDLVVAAVGKLANIVEGMTWAISAHEARIANLEGGSR